MLMATTWAGIFNQNKMKDDEGFVGMCHPLVLDMMWRHRKDKNLTLQQLVSEADIPLKEKIRCDGQLGAEMVSKAEVTAASKHALVNLFKRYDETAHT